MNTTNKLATALYACRNSLHWYATCANGNTPENPDKEDMDCIEFADEALAEYRTALDGTNKP